MKNSWSILLIIITAMLYAFCPQIKDQEIKSSNSALFDTAKNIFKPEDTIEENVDSIFFRRVDSATKNWDVLATPNLDASFQKQYSGTINGKEAIFNINLRAINVREQKDMMVLANIGDTIEEFYVNEFCIYNAINDFDFDKYKVFFTAMDTHSYNVYFVDDSCKSKIRQLKKADGKYLRGSAFGSYLAFRFSKDSADIEGYLQDDTLPINFTLHATKPAKDISYQVYRYHKHRKFQNNKIVEIASTEVLGIDLPNENDKDYLKFLNYQSGFSETDEASKSNPTKQFNTVSELANEYKKTFDEKVKESKIPWSRSIIGGYNNSNIFYNQKGWIVLQTEIFQGDAESYGGLDIDYISYDINKQKFLSVKDVLINNYEDGLDKIKSEAGIDYSIHDFAFVCADGIAFRVSGNHGWEYNFCFFPWKYIRPLLKDDFKKQYAYLWNKGN